jgi:hypothetical protein
MVAVAVAGAIFTSPIVWVEAGSVGFEQRKSLSAPMESDLSSSVQGCVCKFIGSPGGIMFDAHNLRTAVGSRATRKGSFVE